MSSHMLIGYSRVSSTDQNLDRQIDGLKAAGCEKIYAEKITGRRADRPELRAMLDYIREGDTVVVLSIPRLARSNRDLHNLAHQIDKKGCNLKFVKEGIDTSTPHGRMVFSIFGALAEFEWYNIKDRQADGIKSARARGVHLGRPPQDVPDNFDQVVAEWRAGERTAVESFNLLEMSKSTFYKLVRERKL